MDKILLLLAFSSFILYGNSKNSLKLIKLIKLI